MSAPTAAAPAPRSRPAPGAVPEQGVDRGVRQLDERGSEASTSPPPPGTFAVRSSARPGAPWTCRGGDQRSVERGRRRRLTLIRTRLRHSLPRTTSASGGTDSVSDGGGSGGSGGSGGAVPVMTRSRSRRRRRNWTGSRSSQRSCLRPDRPGFVLRPRRRRLGRRRSMCPPLRPHRTEEASPTARDDSSGAPRRTVRPFRGERGRARRPAPGRWCPASAHVLGTDRTPPAHSATRSTASTDVGRR